MQLQTLYWPHSLFLQGCKPRCQPLVKIRQDFNTGLRGILYGTTTYSQMSHRGAALQWLLCELLRPAKLQAAFIPIISQNFRLTQMLRLAKTHSHRLGKQTMK